MASCVLTIFSLSLSLCLSFLIYLSIHPTIYLSGYISLSQFIYLSIIFFILFFFWRPAFVRTHLPTQITINSNINSVHILRAVWCRWRWRRRKEKKSFALQIISHFDEYMVGCLFANVFVFVFFESVRVWAWVLK